MQKLLLTVVAGLLSFNVQAEGEITSLKIDSDTVYFSTSQVKTGTLPACVAAENTDKWTLSLNSVTGKATYALLVAAVTQNRNISVVSGNDCADKAGFERAQSVELGVAAQQLTSYVPAFEDVAYAHYYFDRGNRSCSIYANSNDSSGNPYMEATSFGNCQCNNGSKMVKIGKSTSSSYSYNLKCVIAVRQ